MKKIFLSVWLCTWKTTTLVTFTGKQEGFLWKIFCLLLNILQSMDYMYSEIYASYSKKKRILFYTIQWTQNNISIQSFPVPHGMYVWTDLTKIYQNLNLGSVHFIKMFNSSMKLCYTRIKMFHVVNFISTYIIRYNKTCYIVKHM